MTLVSVPQPWGNPTTLPFRRVSFHIPVHLQGVPLNLGSCLSSFHVKRYGLFFTSNTLSVCAAAAVIPSADSRAASSDSRAACSDSRAACSDRRSFVVLCLLCAVRLWVPLLLWAHCDFSVGPSDSTLLWIPMCASVCTASPCVPGASLFVLPLLLALLFPESVDTSNSNPLNPSVLKSTVSSVSLSSAFSFVSVVLVFGSESACDSESATTASNSSTNSPTVPDSASDSASDSDSVSDSASEPVSESDSESESDAIARARCFFPGPATVSRGEVSLMSCVKGSYSSVA